MRTFPWALRPTAAIRPARHRVWLGAGVAVLTLATGAPALAFTIDGVAAAGNTVDTSFSTLTGAGAMLSLEVGVSNTAPISVGLRFDATDPAVLPFNALLNNLIGLGIERIVSA